MPHTPRDLYRVSGSANWLGPSVAQWLPFHPAHHAPAANPADPDNGNHSKGSYERDKNHSYLLKQRIAASVEGNIDQRADEEGSQRENREDGSPQETLRSVQDLSENMFRASDIYA